MSNGFNSREGVRHEHFQGQDVDDNWRHGLSKCEVGSLWRFHAAALKQVPSCEFFPIETVKTNVLGTENILNAAIETDVKKIVCL